MSAKNIFFVSLGCPKNLVDTEVMLGHTQHAGYRIVDAPDNAEVIVVNTCGFIDAAKEESIETILEMAEFKNENCEKLIVTGCLSQRYPDQLATEIPEIDHIFGSGDFPGIRSALGVGEVILAATGNGAASRKLPIIQVSETPTYIYDHTSPRVRAGLKHSTYVKIAEGCDRPCSFCIIPKLRGPQRSRGIESIVAEANQLVAGGTKEINLIAQDLTRYGADLPDKPKLAALLRSLSDVGGLAWIRLHYTYPSAFDEELISVIADSPKVVNYVDVPLQHIDDSMLKRMRRGHSSRVIKGLIEELRTKIPDVVLRTSFIAGHPGESEEAFHTLRDFIEEQEFERVGVFTYSQEKGTVSGDMDGQVPPEVITQRRDELMSLQKIISRKKHEAMVGQQVEVLVDGVSKESDYLLEGRWFGQAPGIDGTVYLTDGAAEAGDLVMATVTKAADYDIAASLAPGDTWVP